MGGVGVWPACARTAEPELESPLGRMWATWSTAMRSDSIESILYPTDTNRIVGWSATTWTSDSWIRMDSSRLPGTIAWTGSRSR